MFFARIATYHILLRGVTVKKFFVTAVALVCFFAITTTATSNQSKLSSAYITDDVKVKVFGQTVETDVIAAQKAGESGYRNYVSAADLARYLGYDVTWDAKTKTVNVELFPQNGNTFTPEEIEKYRAAGKADLDAFMSKFSARQLDSFQKDVATSQQLLTSDPAALILLFVDDYRAYKEGANSELAYMWESLE